MDCNGLPADGCEAQLDSIDNCGACGAKCSLPHVERELCKLGSGAASCGIDHGCAPDDTNCKPGDAANGCAKGFSDCDQNPANGCEVDLSRVTNCGACNRSCVVDHTLRECKDGQCGTLGCATGYDRCGDSQTCQALNSDAQNCGACGISCAADKPICAGGKCTASNCGSGTADCDANSATPARQSTQRQQQLRCVWHALRSLAARRRRLPDGRVPGRHVQTRVTPTATATRRTAARPCSAVRRTAASAAMSASLRTRNPVCARTTAVSSVRVTAGRGDCNKNAIDGCEANLQLPTNCGTCGAVCAQLASVVSSSCGAMGCNLLCQAGHADCDGRADNGCEADLSDAHSCGACGKNCSGVGHVKAAECNAGVCENIQCDSGYADCNGNPSDGCERAINTLTDCGRCNQACAPAHATGTCGTGQCQVAKCDDGFGDCDGNAQNGCETALSSAAHCGACGNVCQAGSACQNGSCGCAGAADCPTGQTCCNGHCTGTAGSCFPWPCVPGTDLGANRLNCGACGQACLLLVLRRAVIQRERPRVLRAYECIAIAPHCAFAF